MTPIASIAAAAETLAESGPDAEESAHLLALIRRQAERMRELIADLLELAQSESGAAEIETATLPVGKLLAAGAEDFAAEAAARRIRLAVDADASLSIEGDRRRVSQAVRNLLDNAIKFSPEGSKVTLSARRDGAVTELAVADEGPGIPRAEQDKIFQRFYQVDRSRSKTRPGTGLGLAIVKHLAHLQGATVEVRSELGKGSVFTLKFPARG